MKKVFLAVLLLVGVQMSVMAGPGHDHGKDHKPMHGGLFHQAAHDYELVIKDGEVRLYVTDHGNVVNLAGASAKLTVLEGSQKTEVQLKPTGAHFSGQFAKTPGKGARAVVQLKIGGESSTARFKY